MTSAALYVTVVGMMLAACGGQVELTGQGGAAGASASSATSGVGGADPTRCGLDRPCPEFAEICVHDGGCDSPGTCKLIDGDPNCPGTCTCDSVFLCNEGDARTLGLDLGSDPSCMACGDALTELRSHLTFPGKSCTAIARFGYLDLQPIGVAMLCGPVRRLPIDVATAQTIAEAALGPTDTPLTRLGGDEYPAFVFWALPDVNGGVAAVSLGGWVLFAGTSISAGRGDILEPKGWLGAELLAVPCGLYPAAPQYVSGWDLRDGSVLPSNASAALIDKLWRTPIARMMPNPSMRMQILLYPRSVGPFVPESAEWVALVPLTDDFLD